MLKRILIIDDKESILEILGTALTSEDRAITTAATGAQAIEAIDGEEFDIVLCDVRLPDIDGTDLLKRVVAKNPATAVIMITAYGSIQNAIECMKYGAFDYITKPFNLDEIKEVVKKGLERAGLVKENMKLRAEVEKKYDFSGIIGKSKAMQDVFELIRRVAPSKASVLITGETGVGKELVARAIHYNSHIASGNFVALNCAAIPENLLESELFGHVKGAFTGAIATKRGIFEEADGGTLLLDEIAELHSTLQAKLLRVLDEGAVRRVGDSRNIPIDVRLICSTNKDLLQEVERGAFRLDLYHRVKVVEIHIPSLRERPEDIKPLMDFYLEKLIQEHNKPGLELTPEAFNLLLAHNWIGNVRELVNVLEQAVLLSRDSKIDVEQLPALTKTKEINVCPTGLLREETLRKMLDQVEKEIITHILKETSGNRKEAARRLGLSERALYYKLDEHNLK